MSRSIDKVETITKYVESYNTNRVMIREDIIRVYDNEGIKGVVSILTKGINSELVVFND